MKLLYLIPVLLMFWGCSADLPESDPVLLPSPADTNAETEALPPETAPETESEAEAVPFRELRFTAKDGYQSPMLIRITSAEERRAVYEILLETACLDEAYDYTNGCDPDLFTGWLSLTENYDEAWFESHDLYIAVTGEGSSTPKYSASVRGENELCISSTEHELTSDDLIGRHILIETEKGRELFWNRTDGSCVTPADLN